MKKFNSIFGFLFAFAILFTSCSEDEPVGDRAAEITSFSSKNITAKIPTSLATKSPETSSDIQSMIAMMTIKDVFANSKPGSKKTGKMAAGGSQTWTYDGFVIAYTETTDATKMLFEFTIKKDNVTFYTIKGWENKDGSAGHFDLVMNSGVSQVGADTTAVFDWTKNSSNDYNLVMTIDIAGFGKTKYIANIKNNGSGNIKSFEDGKLQMESVWDANGSGTLTDYTTTPPTVEKF